MSDTQLKIKEDLDVKVANLKNDIIKLIKEEDVEIECTYEASFNQNGALHYGVDTSKNNKFVPFKITVPKLIDRDLNQAIIMAHELGHLYVYKNNSKLKNKFIIGNKNPNVVYYNEKQAWSKAKSIVVDLGYWDSKIAFAFNSEKRRGLNSYKPSRNAFLSLIKPLDSALRYWVMSYLLISLFIVLINNGIPIPIVSHATDVDVSRSEFFSMVNGLFFIYPAFLVFKYMAIFSFKTLRKM